MTVSDYARRQAVHVDMSQRTSIAATRLELVGATQGKAGFLADLNEEIHRLDVLDLIRKHGVERIRVARPCHVAARESTGTIPFACCI